MALELTTSLRDACNCSTAANKRHGPWTNYLTAWCLQLQHCCKQTLPMNCLPWSHPDIICCPVCMHGGGGGGGRWTGLNTDDILQCSSCKLFQACPNPYECSKFRSRNSFLCVNLAKNIHAALGWVPRVPCLWPWKWGNNMLAYLWHSVGEVLAEDVGWVNMFCPAHHVGAVSGW